MATVANGPRWRELEIDVQELVQPAPDVAIFTYRASAGGGDDERYRAWSAAVTSAATTAGS